MAQPTHDYDAPDGWLADADDVLQDCLDTFGVAALYQREGAEPEPIPSGGVFRETHTEVNEVTGATVTTERPNLDVRRTEIPDEDDQRAGDRVHVSGRLFRIRDVQKDGELGLKLFLQEAPIP
ncbi:MAG: hypothetical protein AAFR54_11210 [Planctomycetota bacterium]